MISLAESNFALEQEKINLTFGEIVQTRVKFHHQFHFNSTFKCFIRSATLFSTFGVARNDFFEKIHFIYHSRTEVYDMM